ncbi:MAG: hypothetical protein V2B18_04375, partial [Pseudomonadota bacterium]
GRFHRTSRRSVSAVCRCGNAGGTVGMSNERTADREGRQERLIPTIRAEIAATNHESLRVKKEW